MTVDLVRELQDDHYKLTDGEEEYCESCGSQWPCAGSLAAPEIIRLRASNAKLVEQIQAAVVAERERCKRAICEHCAKDIPVRWWKGAGGFWAHHDSVGTNIGSCAAAALRKPPEGSG